MEAGKHGQAIVLLVHEEKRVGKMPQQNAADMLVNDGELKRMKSDAIDGGSNSCTKTSPQAGNLFFIPVLRVDKLLARHGREDGRAH